MASDEVIMHLTKTLKRLTEVLEELLRRLSADPGAQE